jgi:Na+-transporting methylmalonyl-CoA/oxaloacetate decarboxylase gamma subunit
MLTGMGTVFLFLALLVGIIGIVARLLRSDNSPTQTRLVPAWSPTRPNWRRSSARR